MKTKMRIAKTIIEYGTIIVIVLLVRAYVFCASVIPTGSMIPTFMAYGQRSVKSIWNERVVVNKFIYRFSSPKRGDIVVFKSPAGDKKDYVKRCIGLPGDKIKIKKGIVYINDKILVLPGVNVQRDYSYFDEITVPKDNYFMLGDNRGNSRDSRYWAIDGYSSFAPKEDIVGKAIFTFWPLNRMRVLI